MFPQVHQSVESCSSKFFDELRRVVYITPKSYLDGINLFLSQLEQKKEAHESNKDRLENGIKKLELTNE